jgi:hypothetical protein
MCGDLLWRLHLAEPTGLRAFEGAVNGMSDDEVLTVIGTIVGEAEIITTATDWKLLAAVFRKRENQQAAIREILSKKRPLTEVHFRAQITEIFGSEPEKEPKF